MRREPVISIDLRSVGWENNILEVEFTNNIVLQYHPVPEDVYTALMQAQSKTIYFQKHVRNVYVSRRAFAI